MSKIAERPKQLEHLFEILNGEDFEPLVARNNFALLGTKVDEKRIFTKPFSPYVAIDIGDQLD